MFVQADSEGVRTGECGNFCCDNGDDGGQAGRVKFMLTRCCVGCPHSSFPLPIDWEGGKRPVPRESIECRAVVFY